MNEYISWKANWTENCDHIVPAELNGPCQANTRRGCVIQEQNMHVIGAGLGRPGTTSRKCAQEYLLRAPVII